MTHVVALLGVSLIVATACTSDAPTGTDTVPEVTSLPAEAQRTNDGILTIGVLLPVTDAVIGGPLVEAATAAVNEINQLGGVLGQPIELVIEDEGGADATALGSIERLFDADVDAVIGPASSTIALTVLDDVLGAGVLACSPTAAALPLDTFPDEGRFFRTIPSESLQGQAIARTAEGTGSRNVALAYVDDAYGRPYARVIEAALRGSVATPSVEVPFSPVDDDFSDEARALVDGGASTLIIVAASAESVRLLSAIDQLQPASVSGVRAIVVNDTLRTPDAQGPLEALSTDVRDLIIGVAPQTFVDGAPPGPYASNAVDCVNLIALSAALAESDDPDRIARQLSSVSRGGASCATYTRCRSLAESGLQIDYQGAGGAVEIGLDGDLARARFERFGFDEEGRSIATGEFTVEGSR